MHSKNKNLRNYIKSEGHDLEIEIVFSGNVVEHFKNHYSDFIDPTLDVALCKNALRGANMEPIYDRNIRSVKAGIGEIIEKKAAGRIEFTIE